MKLVYQSPKNPNSHLTLKERESPSYPVKQLHAARLLNGRILDFGCGDGVDMAFLNQKGFDCSGYDPHYKPEEPVGQFDTILCTYVLNVLLPEEQVQVLMAVSELLKPSGRAYFTVRRDIQKSGFRTHLKHNASVYQSNVILPYKSVLKTEHCEIYEYRHINRIDTAATPCPFCAPRTDTVLLTESASAYALLDKYPISNGHALIIPKKHISDYFQLSDRTKTACWLVVDRVKEILTERYQPESFNIGINTGKAAGQTIPHAHIHLIPRYTGDVTIPTGGIRNVIPGRADYTR